jgi:hydroxymethylbilane synthase
VPAVGQGAIALQCRAEDAAMLAPALDETTARTVTLERAFQRQLGAGCQIAFAAHATADKLYFFHEKTGHCRLPLTPADFAHPEPAAARILKELGFHA